MLLQNLLPLTQRIQKLIQEHQNPPKSLCSSKKYLVGNELPGQGLGSVLHVAGYWLAIAIQYDRILVWHASNGGSMFVDEGCGTGETFSNLDCIFEPLSSTCGIEYATVNNSLSPNAWAPTPGVALQSWEPPTEFVAILRESSKFIELSNDGLKYWWRAQATAYVARFNRRTRETLGKLRLDSTMHSTISHPTNGTAEFQMPYPLPPGTTDIHVRHGDKGSEMRLVPLSEYVYAAEHFVNQNPLYFRKMMYVSSEDPDVIQEAKNITRLISDEGTPDNEWTVFTSRMNRDNTSPFHQLERFGRQNTTYQWLLTILIALECDMWVGTRASNWNRIIDELRCVWIAKCKQPFLEVGEKQSWYNYWWR